MLRPLENIKADQLLALCFLRVGEDVSAGKLVRLFPDWKINPLNDEVCVYAAYLPNRRNSRKVQVFIDFLSECTERWAG